jgi:hypothetical protein
MERLPSPGRKLALAALPKTSRQDPRFGNLLACHRDVLQGWARRMRSAIREHDGNHLITVGALDPAVFADVVDFHCAHLYPKQDLTLEANEQAWRAHLSRVPPGKPIVVEEFYPLAYPHRADGQAATLAELIAAIRRAAGPHGAGFVSFYWGPPEEVVDNAIGQALYSELARRLVRCGPSLPSGTIDHPPAVGSEPCEVPWTKQDANLPHACRGFQHPPTGLLNGSAYPSDRNPT